MAVDDNLDYGIIGNCTSAALINNDCSIDWLCLPFFDSCSVFAKILDEKKGGHFRIWAKDIISVEQAYLYHTPILKTVFKTKDGIFEVRDYMPRFSTNEDAVYCPAEIHRSIYVIEGNPQLYIELCPRPNYGLSSAQVMPFQDYWKITSIEGEYNSYYLYTNLDLASLIEGKAVVLKGSAYFLLSYHEKIEPVSFDKILMEYERTKGYWLYWAYRSKLPSAHKEMVIRSLITLKLLMFQRTGAVIAAPTTSLPEIIGQERNWDYRYCWVRDASMIIDLFARMGHARTSLRYINFILNRMLVKDYNIRVMYGINGEENLEEKTLDHLSGYKNSSPVRIGNGAYNQKQNDVYGELIETIYTSFIADCRNDLSLNEEVWTVVRSLAKKVEAIWKETDCGIWERRGQEQHFVHSKVMSWVAMDRAAKIAQAIGKTQYVQRFLKVAGEIKEDILKKGWDEELQSFVMYYGGKELDASNLLMLHYGFLDKGDPRIISTVLNTNKELNRNGFILRYKSADEFGLPQNAFIVCTFWMINALHLIGQKQQASQMLDRMIACANRFGLFSEDVDTASRQLTGNFPQGYSHLAFIQTVLLLETDYDWSDASKYMVGK